MKKTTKSLFIIIIMVMTNVNLHAQINELKRLIANENKVCPLKLNAIATLDNIKYEDGYMVYNNSINCAPNLFVQTFKGKKREDICNLADFVMNEDLKELVSFLEKTNTGVKWVHRCIHSDDMVEIVYSSDEIKECIKSNADSPLNKLFGIEYIKWATATINDMNKKIGIEELNPYIYDESISFKGKYVEEIVLVPQAGFYKQLNFEAVKTNRLAVLHSTNNGRKLLAEMVKLDMPLVIIVKDMHSKKSHKMMCETSVLKEFAQ